MFTLLAGYDWLVPDFNRMLPVAVRKLLIDLLDDLRGVDASGLDSLEQVRALLEDPASDVQVAPPQQRDPLRLRSDRQR
jgi:hypothetical protein